MQSRRLLMVEHFYLKVLPTYLTLPYPSLSLSLTKNQLELRELLDYIVCLSLLSLGPS